MGKSNVGKIIARTTLQRMITIQPNGSIKMVDPTINEEADNQIQEYEDLIKKIVHSLNPETYTTEVANQVETRDGQLQLPLFPRSKYVVLGTAIDPYSIHPDYVWELGGYTDCDGDLIHRLSTHIVIATAKYSQDKMDEARHGDGDWNYDNFDVLARIPIRPEDLFKLGQKHPEFDLKDAIELEVMHCMMNIDS